MELIIDIQAMKIDTNEVVFKEIAVVDVNESDFPSTYLFKPPCKWEELCIEAQKENIWLTKNYHGLEWNPGHIFYGDLDTVLGELITYDKDLIIYVKGQQKKQWLQSYFLDVRNLEDYDCPNLRQCTFTLEGACCLYHHPYNRPFNCAVKNVLALKRWFNWYRFQKKIETYVSDTLVNEEGPKDYSLTSKSLTSYE